MYAETDPSSGRGPVIAVIGGGASGTLATIYLLREAARRRVPLRSPSSTGTAATGSARPTPPRIPPTS